MQPTMHGIFLAAAAAHPDRSFIRHVTSAADVRWTYRDALPTIAGHLSLLGDLGLRPGDRAVCYADELVPSVHFMLACAFAGVAFAPLAPSFPVDAAAALARRIGARLLFAVEEDAPRVGGLALPIASAGPSGAASRAPRLHPDAALDLLARVSAGRSDEEPYVIYSTSGTTGQPKLALRTHRSVVTPTLWMRDALGLTVERPERLLLCSGLTHGLGQRNLALGLLIAAEFSIPEGIETDVRLDQVQALDPTVARASPRVVRSLRQQHVARGGDPDGRFFGPALRLLRTSGSRIDVELQRVLAGQGLDVGELYGSSETGMVAVTPVGGWRPGYAGRVPPEVSVRLAEDGEILVKTPALMLGYLDGEEASSEVLTDDGYLRTGDLGEITDDRYIRITGRKKEVLNAPDGTNIFARSIEERIEALPWAAQAIVVGDQRPFLAALVVVAEAAEPNEADGFLLEEAHPALHARARADLDAMNAGLAPIERVRRFALFARPFAPELYGVVANGKVRRHRRAIDSVYASRIEMLYS